ncbi:hypothetical protein [Legionella steelei]|nr:hypothetical protein [Legionella steelei]
MSAFLMAKALIQKFRTALINYLQSPHKPQNEKELTASAFALIDCAAQTCNSIEPGKYMIALDDMVRIAARGIKIHPYHGLVLDTFARKLSLSGRKGEAPAFQVLNLTYHLYLKNNLIDPEKTARTKLDLIQQSMQQLKMANNPYAAELESALVKLTLATDEYFKLSPTEQLKKHAEFNQKLKFVCAEHRAAIESDVRIKSAFYGFLAVIFSIFDLFGLPLGEEYQRKNRFFQEGSLAPKNTLAGFNMPAIEIEETPEEGPGNYQAQGAL